MHLQATDNGTPTTLYSLPPMTADGKDLRLLGVMIQAARLAEAEDYCYQYDRIAEEIGSWTRDELRDAGLLDSEYTVSGYSDVTVTVRVPFSYTGTFASAEAAEQSDPSDYCDVDSYDLAQQVRDGSADFTVDDWTVDSVDRGERPMRVELARRV